MSLRSDLRFRLRAIFRRADVERDLDDELRFHIEREAEKYMREGMSRDAALRTARLAFGGLERMKEEVRDVRGIALLDALMLDVRYAIRGMLTAPAFSLAVILTIGLGIGVNAAMFGIIDRLMFRAPAYLREPSRVHRVYLASTFRGQEQVWSGYEYTRYLDLARWTTSFSRIAAFTHRQLAVGEREDAREMPVATVSAAFFGFFDAPPALGRYFTEDEDRVPFGTRVAVLSHSFWRTRYGGRADVLSQSIRIGPVVYSIIGVAPPGFTGIPEDAPPVAFIPITAHAGEMRKEDPSGYYTNYNWGWLDILVERKPDVSAAAAASADLTTAYRRSWEAERPMNPQLETQDIARPHAIAGPVQELRGPRASRTAQVITWVGGVAFIVLVIACANVANLLLARALRRRREIAVRLALGVSRWRLLQQLLTESLVLAVLGGGGGLVLAEWGGAVLRALLLPPGRSAGVLSDGRTLIVAALLALLTGVLAGLAPLFHAGREDLAGALKAGGREGTYRRSRTRIALLVFQGALSVVLLVGAGLFVRSLHNVRQMRLGYDPEPVLYIYTNPRGVTLSPEQRIALSHQLLATARSVPDVEVAALGLTMPFRDTWSEGLWVPDIDSVQRLGRFTLQAGSPEYFRTMGTHILRGRGFLPEDRANAPRVVVVSERMGRTLWPGEDPIGKCIRVGADTAPCATVVGIAENIRQRSLTEDGELHYYMPIEQFNPQDAVLFVHTRGAGAGYAETMRRKLQPLLPGAAYVTVTPFSEIIGDEQRSWRMGASMFVAFGGLALVIAALGLYSVIAYDIAQRRHEIGVRLALGAHRGDITRLVVRQAVAFMGVGLLVGSAIALVTGRWVADLLFHVSPRDPLVFLGVALVLLIVAVAASASPAFRAARVDPTVTLRSE